MHHESNHFSSSALLPCQAAQTTIILAWAYQQPPNWPSCLDLASPVVYYPQSSCRDPGKADHVTLSPAPPVSFVFEFREKFQRPMVAHTVLYHLYYPLTSLTSLPLLSLVHSVPAILASSSSSSNIQQRPLPLGPGIGPPTGHVLSQEIHRAYFLTSFKTLPRCHLPF